VSAEAFAISEHARMISNMIRVGSVVELDTEKGLVKVRAGGVVSDWIHFAADRAGPVRRWNPPRPGEQVVIACPGGELEHGVVLGSIYQDKYPHGGTSKYQDRTVYPDGSVVEFNAETHTLTVTAAKEGKVVINCKNAEIKATGELKIDTPTAKFTGDIKADGDVQAGSVSLKDHKHGQVQPGSGQTGKPAA
jgi:phage baseplate assembly protein V